MYCFGSIMSQKICTITIGENMDENVKDNVVELMTVFVDPRDSQFYVKWSPTVPMDWKLQFKAGFGMMFKDMPDG